MRYLIPLIGLMAGGCMTMTERLVHNGYPTNYAVGYAVARGQAPALLVDGSIKASPLYTQGLAAGAADIAAGITADPPPAVVTVQAR